MYATSPTPAYGGPFILILQNDLSLILYKEYFSSLVSLVERLIVPRVSGNHLATGATARPRMSRRGVRRGWRWGWVLVSFPLLWVTTPTPLYGTELWGQWLQSPSLLSFSSRIHLIKFPPNDYCLKCCHTHGITGNSHNWLKDWLSKQKRRVVLNVFWSSWLHVKWCSTGVCAQPCSVPTICKWHWRCPQVQNIEIYRLCDNCL